MQILLVKTSSLGDVAHTLSAVREAKQQRPDIQIDWLVEENFADVARLAQQDGGVSNIIPIAFRQWRKKKPFGIFFHPAITALKNELRSAQYDLVIDAQGLIKSAYLARLANAPIAGFDKHSARERIASYCYHYRYSINKQQHAINRLRQLLSAALHYSLSDWQPSEPKQHRDVEQVMLVHATTWHNKHYPIDLWRSLIKQLLERGYHICLPQYTADEYANALAMAKGFNNVEILPKQRLAELTDKIHELSAMISVDTGLAHLSSYLGIPTLVLFGPTDPQLTGALGTYSNNLSGTEDCVPCMKRACAKLQDTGHSNERIPCMATISPEQIIEQLDALQHPNILSR